MYYWVVKVVSQAGFEPATFPLGGGRAIQLCHWDMCALYKKTNKNKQLMGLSCLDGGLMTNVVNAPFFRR